MSLDANDNEKEKKSRADDGGSLPKSGEARDIFAPEVRRIIHEFQTVAVSFDRHDQRLKNLLRELDREGSSWAEISERAGLGYFVLDANGFIHTTNSVGFRLLDMPPGEGQQIPLSQCIHPRHRDDFRQGWEEVKNQGRRGSLLLEALTKDARPVPFRLEARPAGPSVGGNGYVEVLLIDTTGWKSAEETLVNVRRDMESRLAKRTADLKNANRELQKEIAERREYAEALRESEERYRTLVESSFDAILTLDTERNIVSCNPAFLYLFGYGREEIIGSSVRAIHPSDDSFRAFGDRVYPLVRDMGFFRGEWDLMRKDGTVLPAETVTSAMRASDGSILGYVAVIRDISARRRIERVLAHQRELLQTVIDHIPAMVAFLDKSGRIGFVNSAFERILGWTLADAQMMDLLTAVLRDSEKRAEAPASLKASPKGWKDFRITTRSGEEVDTSWSNVALTDGSRLGIGIDISERKRAERELRENRAFIQRITETSPYLLYVYDIRQRKNVFTNQQFFTTLGYTAEEIDAFGGNVIRLLIHPDDQQRVTSHAAMMATVAQNEVAEIEYRIRHRDGQWRWLLDREVVFERNEDGTPARILGTALDITVRKQDEERIRQLTEELAKVQENERLRFARDLHDSVAQDLCALKIGMDTLFDPWPGVPPDLEQRTRRLSLILQRTIAEVQTLAHDLRPFNLEYMSFSQAVAQYCENFSHTTGIDCELNIDNIDDACLSLDARINLIRLLQEVLNNVRKHAEASQVTVRLKSDGSELSLFVQDNGKGFNVEERESASLREHRMGFTGMRERVATLRGRMTVESRENEGSKFVVVVPYREKRSVRQENNPDR